MPVRKLDAAFCLAAGCEVGKKKTDWYDEIVRGFVLECRSSGGKTYYLRYDQDGRQKQHKIAAYGDVTFDKARKEAMRLRSEVVLGGDPAKAKQERKAVPTYAELAAQHLADAKLHQRSYSTTEMYVRRHILPRWGRTRLTDIDPRAVAQWLAEKRADGLKPATVEKIRVIFGRSFELGARWGVSGAEKNPTKGVPRKPLNNARQRYLTPDEAGRLRGAVAASKNPQLKFVVDWLLYTGCRLRECLDARWEHVDLEARRWYIPVAKNGHARFVPISKAASEVLKQAPRFDGCPWLFPNTETLEPFVSIKHAWQTARDSAGLSGLRLHDLRHAFVSFAVASGADLVTVGRLVGHRSIQSTQRYLHLSADSLLAAAEASAAKQATSA